MARLERWACEYNGLVVGSADTPVQLESVDGLLSLPDVRSSDLELVQRDGLWPGDDYMNGRTVTLTMPVYGETSKDFTRALTAVQTAFQPGREEKPLRFWFPGLGDDRAAYVKVRPRKRSGPLGADFAAGTCTLVVELFATDPYIYGVEPRSFTVRSLNSPPPARMRQVGSVPARPVITVENADTATLYDDATHEFFGVAHKGAFTVDSQSQVVLDESGSNINGKITSGSVWPEYANGDHWLRLVNGVPTKAATAVLTWTDRWV